MADVWLLLAQWQTFCPLNLLFRQPPKVPAAILLLCSPSPPPAPPLCPPEIYERLLPGLKHLHGALDAKAQEFAKIIKVGARRELVHPLHSVY